MGFDHSEGHHGEDVLRYSYRERDSSSHRGSQSVEPKMTCEPILRPILLRLAAVGEREEPVPNHMLELPIPYGETDFMVAADTADGWAREAWCMWPLW